MSLVMSKGKDFDPAPAGNHAAICVYMFDLGLQPNYNPTQKPKKQVYLGFELVDCLMEDGRPFIIGKYYTQSLGSKATLRHHLEGWRGVAFTPEQLDAFNIMAVLGKPCLANVIHEPKQNGEIKAKISTLARIPKGMTTPTPANTPLAYDLDNPDPQAYEALPDWVKDKIANRIMDEQQEAPAAVTAGFDDDFDDDIPFASAYYSRSLHLNDASNCLQRSSDIAAAW